MYMPPSFSLWSNYGSFPLIAKANSQARYENFHPITIFESTRCELAFAMSEKRLKVFTVFFQWKENQTRLGMQGSLVMTAIKQQLDVIMSAQQKAPEMKCIESLFTKLSGSFDETHGGFGGAPRFPQPSTYA